MAVTLTVRSGEVQVRAITLDSPRIVIGRGGGCELQLPDPSVSHRHASIRQRGSDYIVLDEGSTNGTWVGPVKLPPGTPRVLASGQLLRVGRIWVEVGLAPAAPSPNPAELTREIALGLVAGSLQLDGQPCAPRVTVSSGPDEGATLVLEAFNQPYVIGRQRKAALVLTDEDISRRHLQLERRGGRIYVQELGSKNGAQLGDQALGPETEVVWSPGQVLAAGKSRFQLVDPLSETLYEIDAIPDERIQENIDVPQPRASGAERDADSSERPQPSQRIPGSQAKPAAGIAQPPGRREAPRAASARGWGMADVLIAALALLVLGLSAAGMAWLFAD